MYIPAHFSSPGADALHRVMADHPLGMLVLNGTAGPDADHLPFVLESAWGEHGRLLAHVARANPLWRKADNTAALVVFRAGDAYISPGWYPSKHDTQRQVPTWNYIAVHVHGTLHVHDDSSFVRDVLDRLSHLQEKRAGVARPWDLADAPTDYIDAMLKAVVGIEIRITELHGKWKLSQNREERDRRGASSALRVRGNTLMATAMWDGADT